ncbi:cell division cycle 20.5, cofactor of APC complex-like [Rosa sericea]
MWEVQSDWYSPTRMNSSPNTQYEFPGDRFIPNRSLMDLDQAQSLLTNRTVPNRNSNFNEAYRQKLQDQLTLDSDGNPFKMLVFRGSPKSSRKPLRCVDEMRRSDDFDSNIKPTQLRSLPKGESRVLDGPNMRNDFYMNILDWGKNNVLAVALGSDLYLWNSETVNVRKLFHVSENDHPTSLAWSQDAKYLAVGYKGSKLQLWDAEASKLVRSLKGHNRRVATITWNGHILTSGSRDRSIINHDVRARNNVTCHLRAHSQEVCGLKWSETGNLLASGGNENLLYIWESSKMNSSKYLYCFKDHCAAVKALAWCPYQSGLLASGGGTEDGCIKLWNTQMGTCINTIDTNSQVCGLEWNRHHKEILSGHGYSPSELIKNQLCLWRYPSMEKVGNLKRHTSRVLQLSQSPDGLTVVSAVADGTLRFWNIFGPPCANNSRPSALDSFLSNKTSPIR